MHNKYFFLTLVYSFLEKILYPLIISRVYFDRFVQCYHETYNKSSAIKTKMLVTAIDILRCSIMGGVEGGLICGGRRSAEAIRSRRLLKRFEEIPKRNFFKSFSLAAGGAA
ncbi:MAG TPA: hypothetical protein PKH33_13130 [bacterium]|nr:hypothetical protein [bacterium]